MHPRSSFVSLAKAGAQEPRWCRCHGTDLSAADIPLARCSGFFSKDVTLRAAETVVVRCPSGRHPVLRGPWIPAFAGKTMREIGAKPGPFRVFPTSATLSMFPPRSPSFPRESGGLGAAVVSPPRSGPQHSELSVGAMRGFTPLSFPPRKRGPRNRGGAAVTERTSAQRAFRRHGVGLPFVRSNPSRSEERR